MTVKKSDYQHTDTRVYGASRTSRARAFLTGGRFAAVIGLCLLFVVLLIVLFSGNSSRSYVVS